MTRIKKYIQAICLGIALLFVIYFLIRYWFVTCLLVLAILALVVQTSIARKFQLRNRLIVYLGITGLLWTIMTMTIIQFDIPKVFALPVISKNSASTQDEVAKQAPTTDPTLEEKVKAAWQPILAQHKEPIALAVWVDNQLITDQTSNEPFYTASIVKVAVATRLLHTLQETNETLSADDAEALRSMIEDSDNEDTTYLLDEKLGGVTALNQLFKDLDMKDTTSDEESWGLTKTTASDQIKLLRTIFEPSDYLTTDIQNQIKELMQNVSTEQRFGLGVLSDQVALKNGWLNDEKEDGSETWIVNSIGAIPTNDNQDYLMAILTSENESMESGQALLQELAEATNQVIVSK